MLDRSRLGAPWLALHSSPPRIHTPQPPPPANPVPYLPDLVRLVLLSSAVHAAAFVALSSMPFAVGQVQDAGLIFLSTMARSVDSPVDPSVVSCMYQPPHRSDQPSTDPPPAHTHIHTRATAPWPTTAARATCRTTCSSPRRSSSSPSPPPRWASPSSASAAWGSPPSCR